jgi:hypothetical protein
MATGVSALVTEPRSARRGAWGKGMSLRGYILAMQRMGLLEAVKARLGPEARRMVEDPPQASQWFPLTVTVEITRAIAAERGMSAVREASRITALEGIAPLWRAAIEGFLRLFGASPATLFARMEQLSALSTDGVRPVYQPEGPNRGTVVIHLRSEEPVELHTWEAFAGTLEAVFEICKVPGTVGAVQPSATEHGVMRVPVKW